MQAAQHRADARHLSWAQAVPGFLIGVQSRSQGRIWNTRTQHHVRVRAVVMGHPFPENAAKSQIWIAVSVYVLVAILSKRLNFDASLYTRARAKLWDMAIRGASDRTKQELRSYPLLPSTKGGGDISHSFARSRLWMFQLNGSDVYDIYVISFVPPNFNRIGGTTGTISFIAVPHR